MSKGASARLVAKADEKSSLNPLLASEFSNGVSTLHWISLGLKPLRWRSKTSNQGPGDGHITKETPLVTGDVRTSMLTTVHTYFM
jgi:hypothetical protein